MKRACFLLLLTAVAALAHDQYTETREYNLIPTGPLDVETGVGAIDVHGWDNAYVYLRAKISADDLATAAAVQIDTAENRIHCSGPSHSSWGVAYDLFVPFRSDLRLKTGVGAVNLSGITGDIAAKTGVGAITIANAGGNVDAKTGVGAIAIDLAGATWDGKGLTTTTGTGAIHLTAPRDYAASFDLRTGMGGIETNFSGARIVVVGFFERTLLFNANGGGAPIQATTGIGQIDLLARN
jgi:hypothetical protein